MKTILPLLFLALLSCGPDGPTNTELAIRIEIADSLSRQRDARMEQVIMDKDRKLDSLKTELIKVKDKAAITDSLVQRRAFRRDLWGKAGSLLGGALGIKINR